MKNIWKWILGIVVVLVLVAGIVGLGFLWRTRMAMSSVQKIVPNSRTWNGPTAPDGAPRKMLPPRVGPRMGMRGFGRGGGHFALGRMFFGLLGRLAPVVILLLLLYVAYRFGRGNVPVAAAAAPAPPLVVLPTHPCQKCGNLVADDLKYCPNCGKKQ